MNPCPCGYLTHPDRNCVCSPNQIDRYRRKLSGPLLDRIDLHLSVGPVKYRELKGEGDGLSSEELRRKVQSARDRQQKRYENEPFNLNSKLGASDVDRYCKLDNPAEDLLQRAVDQKSYSTRTVHCLHKVARTLADFDDTDRISDEHVAEVLQFREFELDTV
jgi:magnesium chelatase family protein